MPSLRGIGPLLAVLVLLGARPISGADPLPARFRAVLTSAAALTDTRLSGIKGESYNAVVLEVRESSARAIAVDAAAAERVGAIGLDLYYWIEVARHEPTADAHPLRMASLQGHSEWRRLFPNVRRPEPGEVTKVHPWTPILYRENFDGHLARVKQLLRDRPRPQGVFLNDLQGAPSACGCGNMVCRWTTDYGPVRTAELVGDDAAAHFVSQLAEHRPGVRIIPVWTTECEEHDRESQCAGVACFGGRCWKEYGRQLAWLEQQVDELAVLCLYKEFGQDVPFWRSEAGWVEHALKTFERVLQEGPQVAASRLIVVVQGWDATPEELAAQIARAEAAGVTRVVVADTRIEQGWSPRIVTASAARHPAP